jgi:hypothetical protein
MKCVAAKDDAGSAGLQNATWPAQTILLLCQQVEGPPLISFYVSLANLAKTGGSKADFSAETFWSNFASALELHPFSSLLLRELIV